MFKQHYQANLASLLLYKILYFILFLRFLSFSFFPFLHIRLVRFNRFVRFNLILIAKDPSMHPSNNNISSNKHIVNKDPNNNYRSIHRAINIQSTHTQYKEPLSSRPKQKKEERCVPNFFFFLKRR
jgi:hypothetical protein